MRADAGEKAYVGDADDAGIRATGTQADAGIRAIGAWADWRVQQMGVSAADGREWRWVK